MRVSDWIHITEEVLANLEMDMPDEDMSLSEWLQELRYALQDREHDFD